MTQDMLSLGFDRIIEQLQEMAVSRSAKQILEETAPILNESLCRARMEETTAARRVIENMGTPPLTETETTRTGLASALQGGMLSPADLCCVARFCAAIRRLRRYLREAVQHSAAISSWHTELPDLDLLEEDMNRSIREDTVLDNASPALRDLRRRREYAEQAIREKLNQIILHHKKELADSYITRRNGCFVLPVQKRYQSQFPGRAVDTSGKGSTVFMEPSAVRSLRQELDQLMIDIDTEERRVLWELSGRVAAEAEPLENALRVMTDLDILFARAKLSLEMDARPAEITAERRIRLADARHPLLNRESCVPLSLDLSLPDAGIAVTGPNTGGKTVCLKTVGLLTLMAQSGLHIPCGEGTVIGMMDRVLCDIGDSQSISQNLSTFSGHMTNVIRILRECSRDSLVLLDELGSGTDPAEGSGLAAAILEELLRRRCFFLVTTHDPQIKQWAEQTDHVVSARMAFDQATLQPLYRLELGKSGKSCAIEIARRLGLDEGLLARARQVTDQGPESKPEGRHRPMPVPSTRLQRRMIRKEGSFERFTMGDSVLLLPEKKTAIVYRPADDDGNVIIQLQGRKLAVRHNRLELLVPASKLYPPDYDFPLSSIPLPTEKPPTPWTASLTRTRSSSSKKEQYPMGRTGLRAGHQAGKSPRSIDDYCLYIDYDHDPARYVLLVEPDHSLPVDKLEEYSRIFEEKLCKANVEYYTCRYDRSIGHPVVLLQQPQTHALWREFKMFKGSSPNQVKPVRILDSPQKEKFFFGMLEEGSGKDVLSRLDIKD